MRRVSDYPRDREWRDGRDRERDRDRDRDRERDYKRRADDPVDDRRRRSVAPQDKSSPTLSNGRALSVQVQVKPDSDKEEGE